MARRVVVTGIGIVSCLGNDADTVAAALKAGQSGISFCEAHAEAGMRSHVAGQPDINLAEHIDRKQWRFMGDAAGYAYLSMQQAIEDAGLTEEQVSNPRTGIVAGSGGASSASQVEAADTLRERGLRRVGPYRVTQTMGSTVSACLATPFKIKGVNYSISSACSTSAHCIGNGAELIQLGKQDVVFAGGGEEEHWSLSMSFDAMGAMSSKYNETPEKASRAFDKDRDGFVISAGGSVLVLEEYERAKARGAKICAKIYAEVTGYGATSDGADMVAPSGEGGERAMRIALSTLPEGRKISYINAHGTSTPVGDVGEIEAVRRVFGQGSTPPVSSTKSMTGHSQGATGAQEAIYCLLALEHDFIIPSINVETLDPALDAAEIATARVDNAGLDSVMTNSFGFGGTNGSMVLSKFRD